MVNSISYQLAKVGHRVIGFGVRRRPVRRTGRGPSKTTLVKRIASALLGTGARRRRTLRGSSYKLSGQGRRPRSTLSTRRTYRRRTTTTHRRPRSTLGGMRVMF